MYSKYIIAFITLVFLLAIFYPCYKIYNRLYINNPEPVPKPL